MPYISPERRKIFDEPIDLIAQNLQSGGEINYCVYRLCLEFIKNAGMSYTNSMVPFSALGAAQSELYRRIIAPYEDQKIAENGDVR
ncbi:MAG: hypothetical protein RRY29_05800 [Desulfovibrionaceae bacterium]